MSVTTRLNDAGIDNTAITNFENDLCENLDYTLFAKMITKFYTVTPSTTDDQYTYLVFADAVVSFVNGVMTKSDEADVVITDSAITIDSGEEGTPADIEQFAFAHHGKGILVMNSDDDYVIKALVYERSASNLRDEFLVELKNLLFSLKIRDAETAFHAIQRLSNMKENILAEMNNSEPRLKNLSIELTPCPL